GKLNKMDRKNYARIPKQVEEARRALEDVQKQNLGMLNSSSNNEEERNALTRFRELSSNEESFYKQKSRENWLSLGDKNTSFFYKKCAARNFRNQVCCIKDSNGDVILG
ncbi:hypothetical protein RF094_12390, partial [Serratia marcescens]